MIQQLNPAYALELQAECRRMSDPIKNIRPDQAYAIKAACIEGTPFYWQADVAHATLTASRSMPDNWILEPEAIPAPIGFWAFGEPVDIVPGVHLGKVEAIAWNECLMSDLKTSALVCAAFFERGIDILGLKVFRDVEFVQWEVGTPIVDPNDGSRAGNGPEWSLPAYTYDFVRFIAAGMQFLRQRIASSTSVTVGRPERRRFMREHNCEPPPVRVVSLRRAHVQSAETDEQRRVDWTYRWVVSGHWRQQWYPSLGINQPKFIFPYVKGPQDLPIKTPSALVYNVKR